MLNRGAISYSSLLKMGLPSGATNKKTTQILRSGLDGFLKSLGHNPIISCLFVYYSLPSSGVQAGDSHDTS